MKKTDVQKRGYAIVGYPGTGKSVAGKYLAEIIGAFNIETGDIVRRGAEDHFGRPSEDISSDELGDYSTMRRDTDGSDYIAQDIIAELDERDNFPDQPIVITGMRDKEVYNLFDDFFDEFKVVWVFTPFRVRLKRIQCRARQDEANFTADKLVHRDEREDCWGTGDLIEQAHEVIPNRKKLEDLRGKLEEVFDK